MKYLKRYNENIDWEFEDEEYQPLNYDKIQPYTLAKRKSNNSIIFIIGDFHEDIYRNSVVTHIYPDIIGEIDIDNLFPINQLKKINKEDLLKLLNKDIKLNNGYNDTNPLYYEYYFDEIYHLLSEDYKKYLNKKFNNILLKNGYN